jgi:hypothetical protein
MITHYGLIFNTMQLSVFESPHRKQGQAEIVTGVVPFSHGYGIGLSHIMIWRGDLMVVFPRFDMQLMLQSVQQYRIDRLYIVRQFLCLLLPPFDYSGSFCHDKCNQLLTRVEMDRCHPFS